VQKDRKTALFRRGDALVTGFNSDQQSFESAAVPECGSGNQLLWRMGPFSGSRPAGFRGVFYYPLPQNPKSGANSNARDAGARVAWDDAGYCAFRESSLSPISIHPTQPFPWRRCVSRVRPRRLPALYAVLGESAPESRSQRLEGLRLQA
jgi:hypothetical protein